VSFSSCFFKHTAWWQTVVFEYVFSSTLHLFNRVFELFFFFPQVVQLFKLDTLDLGLSKLLKNVLFFGFFFLRLPRFQREIKFGFGYVYIFVKFSKFILSFCFFISFGIPRSFPDCFCSHTSLGYVTLCLL